MQTVKNKLCIFNMCPCTSCHFLSLCFIGSYFKNPDKEGKMQRHLSEPEASKSAHYQNAIPAPRWMPRVLPSLSPQLERRVLSIFLGQSSVDLAFL